MKKSFLIGIAFFGTVSMSAQTQPEGDVRLIKDVCPNEKRKTVVANDKHPLRLGRTSLSTKGRMFDASSVKRLASAAYKEQFDSITDDKGRTLVRTRPRKDGGYSWMERFYNDEGEIREVRTSENNADGRPVSYIQTVGDLLITTGEYKYAADGTELAHNSKDFNYVGYYEGDKIVWNVELTIVNANVYNPFNKCKTEVTEYYIGESKAENLAGKRYDEYMADGNVASTTMSLYENGALRKEQKIQNIYTSTGKLARTEVYRVNGNTSTLMSKREFTYYDNGKMKSMQYFDGKMVVASQYTNYDSHGYMVEKKDENDQIWKFTNTYDSEDRLCQVVCYHVDNDNLTPYEKWTYEYLDLKDVCPYIKFSIYTPETNGRSWKYSSCEYYMPSGVNVDLAEYKHVYNAMILEPEMIAELLKGERYYEPYNGLDQGFYYALDGVEEFDAFIVYYYNKYDRDVYDVSLVDDKLVVTGKSEYRYNSFGNPISTKSFTDNNGNMGLWGESNWEYDESVLASSISRMYWYPYNYKILSEYENLYGVEKYRYYHYSEYKGSATGISSVASSADNSYPVYTLSGQKVSAIQAGQMYIQNGKKFIAK